METNRIDNFFGLAGRNTTTKTNEGNGGFADLLFDVMSKRADSMATGPAQIKGAPSLALQPTGQRQLFDADDSRLDSRPAATSFADRRIDKDRPVLARKGDNEPVAKTGPAQGELVGGPARADRKTENVAKVGQGEQRTAEAGATDATDASLSVDGASETDLSDDGQDVALDGEAGQGDTATDGESEQPADQQADAMAGLVVANVTVADVDPVTVDSITAVGDAAVPQAALGAASNPAVAAADPAAALAAAAISDIGGIATTGEGVTPTATGAAAPAGQNGATEEAKSGVTFIATMALAEPADIDADAQAQTAAVASKSERRLEDSGNPFRHAAGNGRKAPPVSSGPTATVSPQDNGTQNLQNTAASGVTGSLAGSTAALGSVAPLGFDTGFGPSAGLPGWNLQLAQGGAVRRGDFVANLRQHLQNLPVHDQVALSIQRSVRDGGGSITLQLSPTELGRIHLKLKIDDENNVQASVVVERPATLDLLQRDMKALERALQEAGLKAGPGDLSFSLQGGDPEAFARDFGSGNGSGSGGNGAANDDGVEGLPTNTAAAVIATGDGWVDVQV